MKIAFVSNGYESLGLEYLSYVLKRNGLKVELFIDPILFNEPNFWRVKKVSEYFDYKKMLINEIKKFNPEIVGFSVLTDTYQWALSIASEIKKINSKIHIFFGGIHPTLLPKIVIKNKEVDCVFIGEAEDIILSVIDVLNTKKYKTIKGAILKIDGRIYCPDFYDVPITSNLKGLFPDKTLFYSKYPFFKGYYMTSLSRGCIFNCSYCINDFYSKKLKFHFRVREIDEVIYELEISKRLYNYKSIHFVDEVFNFNKEFLSNFLKKYKNKINLPFSCYLHPLLVDDEIVKVLRDANCCKVQFGMQSFNEEVRKKVLNRNISTSKIIDVIRKLKNAGIFTVCDHILGIPGDKDEDFNYVCNLYIKDTKADLNEVFFLRYYPKTSITDYAYKNKILDDMDLFNIDNGLIEYGITNSKDYELAKKSQILLLISVFPKSVLSILSKLDLFRKLPTINNILIRIFVRILRVHLRNLPDFYTKQFVKKYLYFISNIFIKKLFRF